MKMWLERRVGFRDRERPTHAHSHHLHGSTAVRLAGIRCVSANARAAAWHNFCAVRQTVSLSQRHHHQLQPVDSPHTEKITQRKKIQCIAYAQSDKTRERADQTEQTTDDGQLQIGGGSGGGGRVMMAATKGKCRTRRSRWIRTGQKGF